MRLLSFLLVAAACYSLQDLQKAELLGACKTYCAKVVKVDTGVLVNGQCACLSLQDNHRIIEKTLELPRRLSNLSSSYSASDKKPTYFDSDFITYDMY